MMSSAGRAADRAALSRGQMVRLTVGGLSLIAACYGLARFAYGLFVPAFRAAFDLDAATAGGIASSSYLAYCLGIIGSSVLTPRLGARAIAVAAGGLAALGTTLIALAPTAAVLTLGVVIAGSSTGVASPPLAHAIAFRVDPRRRARTQTVVNAGTGLGVMVSGPVALMAQEQWRIAWLIFAVIAAAVTVWVAATVPAARQATSGTQARRGGPSSRCSLPPGSLRLLSAAGIMGAASAATWTFGQDLLTSVGNQSVTLSTIAWITLGACGLLGAATGDIINRIGLSTTWVVAILAMGGATAILAAAPQHFIPAVLASGIFGGVYIALTGILLVWATNVFTDQPAKGVGVAFLLIAIGQAGAAPILGAVADHTTLSAAFWISAGFAPIAVLVRPKPRT